MVREFEFNYFINKRTQINKQYNMTVMKHNNLINNEMRIRWKQEFNLDAVHQ